jgi:hypothetical protein
MWTLLVLGHRDPELYRAECIRRLDEVVGLSFFDRLVLSLDRDGVDYVADKHRPWDVLHSGGGKGLTANVQQAWDALGSDEWVFHVEEDFLVDDAPLEAMRTVLVSYPHVAQMVLERQPVAPQEFAAGGLLGAQCIPTYAPRGTWREQDHLFSFNPFVAHSSVLTEAGTETSVTQRLRADGWTFGFWGRQGDAPRVRHVGVQGGMGSPGWRA